MTTNPIVVGVDGSASALHAVRWAAREAMHRNTFLRLVHVCSLVPPGHADPVALLDQYADTLLDNGWRWLSAAADAARAIAGTDLKVVADLRDGTTTKVLMEESGAARMVVLGSRGLGGFAELLAGSIAVTLAGHAHCPVVVLPSSAVDSSPADTGPVVVGVDGSTLSEAAVAFAFDAASLRGVPLLAVHTWLDVELAGAWTPLPVMVDWAAVHAEEERLLAERLAEWRGKYPTVEVRSMVSKDRPAKALLRAAESAQLVVVGSRGRGALIGFGLGSVSQYLLHHAPCPVAVIRQGASRP